VSGKFPGGFVTAGAPAGYSVAFDGTGDYLSVANNAAFNFGTGDFTLEAWIYVTTFASNSVILDKRLTAGGVAPWLWFTNTTGNLIFYNGTSYTTTTSFQLNSWNHVAASRVSGTLYQFINGVSAMTPVSVTANLDTTGSLLIGVSNDTVPTHFKGYISNVRILKGTGLYTAAFTPPTQLFPITNTSLLTCQSPTIIDVGTANSGSGFPITTFGDAKVSTFTPFTGYTAGASGFRPALGAAAPGVWTLEEATYYQGNRLWPIYDPYFNQTTLMLHGNSPTNLPTWITDASPNNFALTVVADAKASSQTPFSISSYPTSGSAYFDGTGDYLLTPSNAAFNPSGSDITVDFFVYLTRYAATNNIIFEVGTSAVGDMQCNITNTGAVRFTIGGSTGSTISGFTLNTWHYVTCVKSGTNFTVYLNGTAGTTVSLTANSKTQMYIGAQSGGNNIDGYISNFRFVKGSATIPSGVPTAPLTAVANTSLLTLQNAQPTANSSFTDSSTNNFPITRFGNTTQGTFTPFSQTGWGNYIAGANDYIKVASNAAYGVGTGNFTLEAFFYVGALGTKKPFTLGNVSSEPIAVTFTATTIRIDIAGTTNIINVTQTIPLNSWNHIAFVRSGTGSGQVALYLNGSRITTGTSSGSIAASDFQYGGIDWTGSYGLIGHYSNVRYSNTARYSGTTYTVPTEPFTSDANTLVLAAQSNRFVNTSSYGGTVTVSGASVQTFSPFPPLAAYTPYNVGGSGYFDGTGDYLSIADNAAFTLGNSNFCIELWIYPTANMNNYANFIGQWANATTNCAYTFRTSVSNAIQFAYTTNGNATTGTTVDGSALRIGSWNHIVVCRSGVNLAIFQNGARTATNSISTNTISDSTRDQQIGFGTDGGAITGYMSSLRMAVGSSVYDPTLTTITIPTAPANPTGSNLCLNFTNAGIIDSTADNVLETVGNVQISTVQSKWGGSSMVFNGTNSYLKLPSNVQLAFGTGNFTIEFWAYFNVVNAAQTIIDFRPDATGNSASPYLELTSGGAIIYFLSGGTQITTSALSANTWYHIALVRSDGINNRIYVNGVQSGSTFSNSSSLLQSGITVGFNRNNGGTSFQYLNGYIDDLRITSGIARYLGNFTPPTSQLQSQ
jgi:hypothetical protein